jgi:hypothetical protein
MDLSGNRRRLSDYRGRLVVLNFWSAECPWSERADRLLTAAARGWGEAVALLSIASNANEPPELLARAAGERGLRLVLLDPQQEAADRYAVQAAPHLAVVDAQGVLRYQGGLDDVSFGRRQPTRSYLLDAVQAVLEGRLPDPPETPAYGCALVRLV